MANVEFVTWMASPPLAPTSPDMAPDETDWLEADMIIDTDHLARMTLGDASLRREILELFDGQADRITGQLRSSAGNAAEQAHTLSGAARAVGAFIVADAAESLERQIRCGGETKAAIAALDHAVTEARAAIAGLLQHS